MVNVNVFNLDCWYKHSYSLDIEPLTESHEYKCNSCGKEVTSRNELMIHRKKVHPETVSVCGQQKNGKCDRSEQCWYKHNDEMPLDFQKVWK